MTSIKTIPKSQAPAVQNILQRMPKEVADSFTEEQLNHLHAALGVRSWKKHAVDLRFSFAIPLTRARYYCVFLLGKNRRELSRREARISAITTALLVTLFITACTLFGLLVLYLIKSALGINLIEGYSTGIWDWFKETFL
ncbi:hypothetical protein [Glaciecola sp. 1036]|uniref:hypothetical protein n=1 Tax=Alteromonadaceae TaxID=72275 RepID=UPI003D023410